MNALVAVGGRARAVPRARAHFGFGRRGRRARRRLTRLVRLVDCAQAPKDDLPGRSGSQPCGSRRFASGDGGRKCFGSGGRVGLVVEVGENGDEVLERRRERALFAVAEAVVQTRVQRAAQRLEYLKPESELVTASRVNQIYHYE